METLGNEQRVEILGRCTSTTACWMIDSWVALPPVGRRELSGRENRGHDNASQMTSACSSSWRTWPVRRPAARSTPGTARRLMCHACDEQNRQKRDRLKQTFTQLSQVYTPRSWHWNKSTTSIVANIIAWPIVEIYPLRSLQLSYTETISQSAISQSAISQSTISDCIFFARLHMEKTGFGFY